MKHLIKTIGTIIFSAITRLALCIWLLFTDPGSVTFRYLLVIIFCIPLLRYFIHKTAGTSMQFFFNRKPRGEITRFALFAAMLVVYLFIVPHVFSVYSISFPGYLLVIASSVAVAYILVKKTERAPDDARINEHALLMTMAFYTLPFLAGINYAFDLSRPATIKYLVTGTGKHSFEGYSEPEERKSEITSYYLHLLPADSIITPPQWVEVGEEHYKKDLNPGCTSCIVLDRERRLSSVKAASAGLPDSVEATYHLLVLKTNALVARREFEQGVYNRFTKGDYLYSEAHHGLLGFSWHSYR